MVMILTSLMDWTEHPRFRCKVPLETLFMCSFSCIYLYSWLETEHKKKGWRDVQSWNLEVDFQRLNEQRRIQKMFCVKNHKIVELNCKEKEEEDW